MSVFFQNYNIIIEITVIAFLGSTLFSIYISKPKETYLLKLCKAGMYFSIATMIFRIGVLVAVVNLVHYPYFLLLYFLHFLYGSCYVTVLNLMFSYVSLLSYKRRLQKKSVIGMITVASIVSAIIIMFPVFTRHFVEPRNGLYMLTKQANSYVFVGVLYLVICQISLVRNKHEMPKAVQHSCMISLPGLLLAVLYQIYFPNTYLMGAAISLPYVFWYFTFHAFHFDEIIGCQNYDAESTFLHKLFVKKKQYFFASVGFPELKRRDLGKIESIKTYVGNDICRRVESINRTVRIYKVDDFHYQMIAPIQDDQDYIHIKNQFLEIMNKEVVHDNNTYAPVKNMLISRSFNCIDDEFEYEAFIRIQEKRFLNLKKNEIIEISEADAEKYKRNAVIEKALLDIKRQNCLDDSRVDVYVQPIYSIEQKSFQTGEALMRLLINDEMYFPDEFIPIAEEISCIHMLTRIMLHKVSQKVAEMSKFRCFEALTVNVSTMELTEPGVSDEFLNIIRETGCLPNQIRIEITESTIITNYDVIIENIIKLKEQGVYFYLDDFGTGYSNIDRIITIPFSTIKFDKSLLYKALEEKNSEELFILLAQFFKRKGIKLVMEGVEDEHQKEYIEKIGFDYIQGYFYSKPVKIGMVDDFYNEKK